MTLDEIDWLLAQWNIRIDTAAECLSDLRGMPSYEFVAGSQKLQLTGITEQKLGVPIAALDRVWTDYATLCATVLRATELRKQVSRFSISPEKLRELESILTGSAIAVTNSSAAADRDFFGSKANPSLTLEQLLDRMNAEFVEGRNALAELDSNWTKLNAQLLPLTAFAEAHSTNTAAGMAELCAALDALRPRVIADPMRANADFESKVRPLYERVRAAVEKSSGQRENLDANLQLARKLLKSLPGLHAQSDRIFHEFHEKISGRKPTEPALDPQRIRELEARLARMETGGGGNEIDSVCADLEQCLSEMQSLIADEQRALMENRAALELRRELRGRLSAFKARAVAHRRAEDPKLTELARRADDLLYARPTPLDEAFDLVTAYGRASL